MMITIYLKIKESFFTESEIFLKIFQPFVLALIKINIVSLGTALSISSIFILGQTRHP